MAVDKTYFEIEIETDKAQKKLDELIKKADELTKANQKNGGNGGVSKEEKKTISEIQKLTEQLQKAKSKEAKVSEALKLKIQTVNAERKASIKLAASEKGSYNALSAEYSKLKIQINAMGEAERNTAKGKELINHSRELYEQMKKLQEETGKAQLNVGNYKSALQGATGAMSAMGGPAAAAAGGITKMATAAKAFIATPIGAVITAVVAALAAMKKALSSTAEGQKKLASITGALKGTLNGLVEILVQAGELLYDLFTGNWKGVAENAKDVAKAFGDLPKVAKNTAEISRLREELEQKEAKFVETEAKLSNEIAKQNLIARDTRKTADERAAALEKMNKLDEEITAQNIKFQKEKIALLEMEQALTSTDAQGNAELSQAKADLINLETELLNKQAARLKLDININKEEKKTTDDGKNDAERRKNQLALEQQLATQKRNIEKQNLAFLQGDQEAYYNENLRLLDQWLKEDIEKENERYKNQVENADESGENLEDIKKLHDDNILTLHLQHLADMQAADDKYDKYRDELSKKEQDDKEKKVKAEQDLQKARINAAVSTANALASILQKQGEKNKAAFNASKVLQASSTAVTGIEGAIGAFNQAAAAYPPPYGEAIGAANAAAIGVSTAAAVANIMSQQWNSPNASSVSTASSASTTATQTVNETILDRVSTKTETATTKSAVLVVDEVTAKQKQITAAQKVATV